MKRLLIFSLFIFSIPPIHADSSQYDQMRIFSQLYGGDTNPPELPVIDKVLPRFSKERLKSDIQLVRDINNDMKILVDSLPELIGFKQPDNLYSPEEEDRLRGAWLEFLNYRSILLRLMARYESPLGVEKEADRERSLLLSFSSSILLHHMVGRVIVLSRNHTLAWRKFNEGDPAWGLKYDLLYSMMNHIGKKGTQEILQNALVDYRQLYPRLRRYKELLWVHQIIQDGFFFFRENSSILWKNRFEVFLKPIKDFFYKPYYYLAATISTWISEFQYRKSAPLITPELVDELLFQLQPGDLVLERRHFYLTNIVLPGYWPHVVMYVGTRKQIHELGLLGNPKFQKIMAETEGKFGDTPTHYFVDALTKGVSMTTQEKRLNLDSIAVLRPRVPLSVKKQAIWRALNYLGKPYDFEFDLFSADKIICSEVIYRAYGSHLNLQLTKIMGRMTLPPVNIANSFIKSRKEEDRPLDFVLFFKGVPQAKKAFSVNEDDFAHTMLSGENPLSPRLPKETPGLELWP
jgi:hypothetical protein